ncbi:FAD-dependent oxidoreductase [Streptomyces sp. L7]
MTAERTIVIIGAGVSGLTTGVALLEAGHPVRLVAEEVPGVTSLAAGAMWGPYLVEPWERVREWSLVSLSAFEALSSDPTTGVRMVSGIEAARSHVPAPAWSGLLPNFPYLRAEGATGRFREWLPVHRAAHRHAGLPAVPVGPLPEGGGVVERATIQSLEEVEGASAIINCAGLAGGDLAGDLRGSTDPRSACGGEKPGRHELLLEDTGLSPDLLCIYPHGETVVLGGSAIDGEGDLRDDPETARAIVDRCAEIEPALATAQVIAHRVGARPTRAEVRVEAERLANGVTVFHNYGHGGSGVTLSWGCAGEIAALVAATMVP